MIGPEIRQSIQESILCWLATVNPQGEPNVSPKEMFVAYGEQSVLIANIASPKSVANIAENSSVCLSFVNVFKQKGFKLKGKAKIIRSSDANYESMLQALRVLGGEAFPINSIIEVTVKDAEPIIAPSYWLFPDTTEQSQIAQAMKSYGVKPLV